MNEMEVYAKFKRIKYRIQNAKCVLEEESIDVVDVEKLSPATLISMALGEEERTAIFSTCGSLKMLNQCASADKAVATFGEIEKKGRWK